MSIGRTAISRSTPKANGVADPTFNSSPVFTALGSVNQVCRLGKTGVGCELLGFSLKEMSETS